MWLHIIMAKVLACKTDLAYGSLHKHNCKIQCCHIPSRKTSTIGFNRLTAAVEHYN